MFGWVHHLVHHVVHFVAHHWRQIATIAAAVAVGALLTVALGPAGLGAAWFIAAGAGGLGAGATSYIVSTLLTPRARWSWSGFAKTTLLSGALAVATAGVGELVAPTAASVAGAVVPDAVSNAIPAVARTAVSNAAAGSAFGAGSQAVLNLVDGRPVTDGLGTAALTGGATGGIVGPILDAVLPPPPAGSGGIVGAFDRIGGSTAHDATPETPIDPHYAPNFADPVGSGGFKVAYITQDDPNTVIAIARDVHSTGGAPIPLETQLANMNAEVAGLQKIADLGLPVQKIEQVGVVTGQDGQPHAAIVSQRYATSSRTDLTSAGARAYLNQNTIDDLQGIEATLQARDVAIHDLQFLIAADGHVVVNDPLAVVSPGTEINFFIRGQPGYQTMTAAQQDQNEINYVLDAAHQAIAERANPPGGP